MNPGTSRAANPDDHATANPSPVTQTDVPEDLTSGVLNVEAQSFVPSEVQNEVQSDAPVSDALTDCVPQKPIVSIEKKDLLCSPGKIKLTDNNTDQLYEIDTLCGDCNKEIIYNELVDLCFDCNSFYCKSCYSLQAN